MKNSLHEKVVNEKFEPKEYQYGPIDQSQTPTFSSAKPVSFQPISSPRLSDECVELPDSKVLSDGQALSVHQVVSDDCVHVGHPTRIISSLNNNPDLNLVASKTPPPCPTYHPVTPTTSSNGLGQVSSIIMPLDLSQFSQQVSLFTRHTNILAVTETWLSSSVLD